MLAMLVFTVFSNLSAWGLLAITDHFLAASPMMFTVMIAECFAFPIGAYVVYGHLLDNAGEYADRSFRHTMMSVLVWFTAGAAVNSAVIKYLDTHKVFSSAIINHEKCMTFAFSFVIGFMLVVGIVDLIGFVMNRPAPVAKNHF
ncbi:MAG: hypothetical protein IJ806_10160 [Ruminococcus sp.]|nr:hypothetical protein [Ruminococcus sp.]